jgi:hypothetical protein
MHVAAIILVASAAWPLWIAARANVHTTLRSSVTWAGAAWAVWLLALATRDDLATYLALCLSGCAGIAVLGARRPGVGAWNFVVAGLLAVLLLPMARVWGTVRLEAAQVAFLGAVLAVPVLNYLPTRLAPSVLLSGLGCAAELTRLTGASFAQVGEAAHLCLAAGPWLALLTWRRDEMASEFERTWLGFRDRFGIVWGQRAREQFNKAAENAGWAVVLTWHGLQSRGAGATPGPDEMRRALAAVLKRFSEPEA